MNSWSKCRLQVARGLLTDIFRASLKLGTGSKRAKHPIQTEHASLQDFQLQKATTRLKAASPNEACGKDGRRMFFSTIFGSCRWSSKCSIPLCSLDFCGRHLWLTDAKQKTLGTRSPSLDIAQHVKGATYTKTRWSPRTRMHTRTRKQTTKHCLTLWWDTLVGCSIVPLTSGAPRLRTHVSVPRHQRHANALATKAMQIRMAQRHHGL